MAQGEPFLGFDVQKSPVLYLDGENPLSVVRRNLESLGIPQIPHLKFWGGWVDTLPPSPSSPIIQHFAQEEKGLVVYDPVVALNPGEENSPNETRAFMNKLRDLSNPGATVLVLHHSGKSEGSKVYRGSSDYKASVDMAYLLRTVSTRNGALDRLSLNCFKGRMAPGKNLELEFREGKGFVGHEVDNPQPGRLDLEIFREIVHANPQINQSAIVELAQQEGLGKHKVEECLNNGGFGWTRGKGNTKLYHLKDSPGTKSEEESEGDLPNFHPLEEGISGNQLCP